MNEIDLEIFRKFVMPHHTPLKNPVCMIVGAMIPYEGLAMKNYYRVRGFSEKDFKIVGCNIRKYPPFDNDRYFDLEINDSIRGDARMNTPYETALSEFERDIDDKFDMVYIRNPSLFGNEDWPAIFSRAIDRVHPKGVVVSLIREEDLPRNDLLKHKIMEDFGIKVFASSKTGNLPEVKELGELGSFFHTVDIYKPSNV